MSTSSREFIVWNTCPTAQDVFGALVQLRHAVVALHAAFGNDTAITLPGLRNLRPSFTHPNAAGELRKLGPFVRYALAKQEQAASYCHRVGSDFVAVGDIVAAIKPALEMVLDQLGYPGIGFDHVAKLHAGSAERLTRSALLVFARANHDLPEEIAAQVAVGRRQRETVRHALKATG